MYVRHLLNAFLMILSFVVLGSILSSCCCNKKEEACSDEPSPGLHPCYWIPDPYRPSYKITEDVAADKRVIETNNIPFHIVGRFPNPPYNPDYISEVNEIYRIPLHPSSSGTSLTPLLNLTSGPAYEFGIAINGITFDPVANEPWAKDTKYESYEWNLEAINNTYRLGLDCNYGHVQPVNVMDTTQPGHQHTDHPERQPKNNRDTVREPRPGIYHYHGIPTGLIDSLVINKKSGMILVGFAADGFPVYYLFGDIKKLRSSWQLKTGNRPGDGISAPCGVYDGTYTNDYEFVSGSGDLDRCNGTTGTTPEFGVTYFYVITEEFPMIPRFLKGKPSNDFKIGP